MIFYVFKVKKNIKVFAACFFYDFWKILYKAWSGSETMLIKKKKDEKIKLKKRISQGGVREKCMYTGLNC